MAFSGPLCFGDIEPMRRWVRGQQASGKTVGLVPTMGALHEGHLSLVDAAQRYADVSVVTIFVNPSQFAPSEDLDRYPRPLRRDLDLLAQRGVHAVFLPTTSTMYPPAFGTTVQPSPIARQLEGAHRPTHFRGVATVVLKLFQIIPAEFAFFGQKDFQQWRVIERMTIDLNLPIKVIGCPIVRDVDGLAMSSRNVFLTDGQRSAALAIHRGLALVQQQVCEGETRVSRLEASLQDVLRDVDQVDYAVLVDADSLLSIPWVDRPTVALVAVRVGATRLIDNCLLTPVSDPNTP